MIETPASRTSRTIQRYLSRTPIADTWLRELEKRGRIPKARRTDPGGKRKFWFDDEVDDEVDAIVRGTGEAA